MHGAVKRVDWSKIISLVHVSYQQTLLIAAIYPSKFTSVTGGCFVAHTTSWHVVLRDVAPTHFSLTVRQWLGRHYSGYWIGRGPDAPVPWPPRSPDLNSVDLYLWGSIKNAVHANIVDTESIFGNAYRMQQTRLVPHFECVRASFRHPADSCVHAHAGHFENLLCYVQQV
jgi:hypothetical protein